MKYVILAMAIVVVGISLFLFFKPEARNKKSGQVANFQVAVLDTDVFKKTSQDKNFEKIEKESEAVAGDQLKSSSTGRATILEPNGNLASLGKNSTITLALVDPAGGSKIKLEAGDIWSKIKRLSGQEYEVETENMVAAVRGTAFAVKFDSIVSRLFVLEGTVRAKIKYPKTGELTGLEIDVAAGFKVFVDSRNLPKIDADLKIQPITAEDLEIEIIKDNLGTLDALFKLKTELPILSATPSQLQNRGSSIFQPNQNDLGKIGTSPSPAPTIRPTPTPTPTPIPTLQSFYNPAPTPQASIQSVTPKTLDREFGQKFAINGQKLFGTETVLLGDFSLPFVIIDESTIFATVGYDIQPGTYDVSITTSAGNKLTLSSALTVR